MLKTATTIPVGTYSFHSDPNFNYQMNRWTTFGNLPVEVIAETALKINTIDDYCSEFLSLAKKAEKEDEIRKAAFYYRSVDFFLPYSHLQKQETYDKTVKLLRQLYADYFINKRINEGYMKYEDSYLPVWSIPTTANKSKGNILFTGGFDCLKEEMIPSLIYLADAGYDVYYFEGPGQGQALIKNGIAMTHEWEKPVSLVLDYFKLSEVTIIGMSLGSYFAPRAAIHDNRIKKVILWGIMYDFFDVVVSRRGKLLEIIIKTLLKLKLDFVINGIIRAKMKRDAYTHWGLDHGMHVLGVSSPANYFRKLKQFSLKGQCDQITQDILLTSGTHDHFVPLSHMYAQMHEMTNVHSMTTRIFTKEESGENHCQFGNIKLTLDEMIKWIC